jgi:hypothetical protein
VALHGCERFPEERLVGCRDSRGWLHAGGEPSSHIGWRWSHRGIRSTGAQIGSGGGP